MTTEPFFEEERKEASAVAARFRSPRRAEGGLKEQGIYEDVEPFTFGTAKGVTPRA